MTLDEAKQKILDRVLATTEGWERLSYHASVYSVSTTLYTSMACKALRGLTVCRDQETFSTPDDQVPWVSAGKGGRGTDVVTVQSKSGHPTTFITSDEYPQLLEWWGRAEKASAEQRVIQFAESLP